MSDYRVLVTGSRAWSDRKAVFDVLDRVLADFAWAAKVQGHGWTITVVHGANPAGADKFAHMWFLSRRDLWHGHVFEDPHPADWARLGKSAGGARNQVMVDNGAAECHAFFWDGSANTGTADCVARAEAALIEVQRHYGGSVLYTEADRSYDLWAHGKDYG